MSRTRVAILCLLLMVPLPIPAQESVMSPEPVRLAQTEDHSFHSEHVGADFRLWVAHPVAGWQGPAAEPPRVLYVLDADLFFGTAVEMTRLMHQLYGELPPLLVVGIAYGSEPRVQAELRNRDFTPTVDERFAAMRARLDPGGEPLLPEGQRMGRAAEFLAFLTEELQPWVGHRFEVSDEGSVLFGSSLGGLFTLYALLQEPGAFDHYVAVSPALWWDDEVLFGLEEETALQRDDLDASLYLAVGALEESPEIPMLARFRLVTNVGRMADRLTGRGYPSLRVERRVLEGESHTSVVPTALTRALRAFFPPAPAPFGG